MMAVSQLNRLACEDSSADSSWSCSSSGHSVPLLSLESQEELAVHCASSKRMNISWLISDFLLCAGLTCRLVVLWPLRMLARACLPKSLAFVPSALCSERRFWSVSVLSKHYRKASGWLESFCSSCSPNRRSLCSESVLRAEIWL